MSAWLTTTPSTRDRIWSTSTVSRTKPDTRTIPETVEPSSGVSIPPIGWALAGCASNHTVGTQKRQDPGRLPKHAHSSPKM